MRLLFITHTKDGSGARVALVNLVKGLKAKGHSIFVVAPSLDCLVAESMRSLGVSVVAAPVSVTVYPNTHNSIKWVVGMTRNLRNWHKAKRVIYHTIISNRIDLVHTNVGPMNLAPPICRKVGIPHVWHIREFQSELFFKFFPYPNQFKREVRKKGNYNIAITQALFHYYSLRDSFDIVVYDGVFPKSISNVPVRNYQEREKIILTVGRVEEGKGTKDLINAFSHFHITHREWKLRIVGDYNIESPYFQECKRLCESFNNTNGIEFLGKRNDVYDLMCNARIFVMASKREGFGFVTAEAMANGCLVIGRNTAGTKEQFDNGRRLTGSEIALRFESQEELLKQLENAVELDYSGMIDRGRNAAIEQYSIEKNVENIEYYYSWIIKHYYE